MPQFPSTFPIEWIALTAAVACAASFVVLLALNPREPLLSTGESALVALVAGLYAALRRAPDSSRWERARALLTVVSFVVNVIVI